MLHILKLFLILFCTNTFAIGDSIATTEGGLYFAIGIGVFILLCVTAVVYFCLKIAGQTQRLKWFLIGGLPSVACALLFSWKLAIIIAFGVALTIKPKNTNHLTSDKTNLE